MYQTMTLEIRHQISVDTNTGEYILREMFGEQPAQEWRFAALDKAKEFHAFRQKLCKAIVASVSPDAAMAVANAREVDNLKAGHA